MKDDPAEIEARLKDDLRKELGVRDETGEAILSFLVDGVVTGGEAQHLARKGARLADSGNHREALELYEKVLALDPNDAMTWANKGRSMEALKRHDEALVFYAKAAQLDPQLKIQPEQARCLMQMGRLNDALPVFDQAVSNDRENAPLIHNRGVCLLQLDRNSEALEAFDRVLELNPKHAAAARMKVNALQSLGRPGEAAKAMQDFLTIYSPEDAQGLFRKGKAALESGFADIAEPCFRKVTELLPAEAEGWHGLGAALSILGRFEDSAAAFQKAVGLDPENIQSRGALITVLTRTWKRDLDAGKKDLLTPARRQALLDQFGEWRRVDPQSGQPWMTQGAFHFSNEEYAEAIRCMEEARNLGDPKAPMAIEALLRVAREKGVLLEPKKGGSWFRRLFGS